MLLRITVLLCVLMHQTAVAAEPKVLRAGKVSLVFEPELAFVRYIKIGGHKVLQGISAPVRDQYWGTVPPQVSNLQFDQTDNSFAVHYDVECRQGNIDFTWHGTISGRSDGKLTLTFDGKANSDFLRNRIGFCVLHGPEAAGKKCLIETVDGGRIMGQFPTDISPHQPFKNIRSIAHEVAPGVWAKVRMEGDTFEMEDQRNWTDASFKTYCTPLEIPYPVRLAQGTKVSQRIEISLDGIEKLPAAGDALGEVTLRVGGQSAARTRLPGIGLRVSSQTAALSDAEVARLGKLHLDHLRVDISPAEPSAVRQLQTAAEQAQRIGVPLWVGLHLGANAERELHTLADTLARIPPPSTWLLIAADDAKTALARTVLARPGMSIRIGRGEDTNFTELNRNRPSLDSLDAVSYGINPQIHAFDDLSIVETLEIQGDTVRSARRFTGKLPLLVSPITLKKQALDEPPAAGQLPANVDPRQASPFAAVFTLGSIKYLSEAGVDSITYFETVGWLGVMESEDGPRLPGRFPSQAGQIFPVYFVLQEIGDFAGGHVRTTPSSDPMSVIGLTIEKDARRRILIANLTSNPKQATVQGVGENPAIRFAGSRSESAPPNVLSQGQVALTLPPWGIVVFDSVLSGK